MESSFHSINALSPESTVTSLLSSSGHLTSNLHPSTVRSSFTFKNKEYESASATLDAYISDFERSRPGNVSSLGAGLVLPPSSPHRIPVSRLRNRDVLRERLCDRELDFLSLPVSSLCHRSNRDRLSMTTDELMSIPNDGSMPVTHTTAYIHGVMSKSGASQQHSALKHSCSQSHTARASHPIRMLRCSRCRGAQTNGGTSFNTSSALKAVPRPSLSLGPGPPSLMHLPHWLSSNKAAVDCSEIHSLPELPYPPWIHHCDPGQSERSLDGQSEGGHIEDFPASAPSWVEDLDDEQQADSELTLRDLRLQLAEQISLLASERKSSDAAESLFRDRRMESLIQKADQVLDSLTQTSASPQEPVRTEDLLLPDSDPGPSPAAQPSSSSVGSQPGLWGPSVGSQPGLWGPSVGSQPGPLEAIKQILFRLQAVETELEKRQTLQQGALQERLHWEGALQNPDPDDGARSLQRALHHLSRLKLLVEKPEKLMSEEEKDEGRFSSSSTEGLGPGPASQGKKRGALK